MNFVLRPGFVAVLLLAGCSTSTTSENNVAPDAGAAACVPTSGSTAPTYTTLYTTYFAAGTPGHCANAGCHGSAADNHTWVCGTTKETCYAGMVGAALINQANPTASRVASTSSSPIFWVNPTTGTMPQDRPVALAAGAQAIEAWAADCAQDN